MSTTTPPSGPPTPDDSPAGAAPADKPPVWRRDDGAPVSCLEKIKVLNENYAELRQMTQDAFEDALLLGCSEAQVRAVLRALVDELRNPYPGSAASTADD